MNTKLWIEAGPLKEPFKGTPEQFFLNTLARCRIVPLSRRAYRRRLKASWKETKREFPAMKNNQKRVLSPPAHIPPDEGPYGYGYKISKNSPWVDIITQSRKKELCERVGDVIQAGIEYNNRLLTLSRELREVLKTTNGAG